MELRLTVDFASELIYRDRQHRWSSNGPRDFAFVGKNSTADNERNVIGSARSAFIIPIVTAKVDELQNSWCRSHVAQEGDTGVRRKGENVPDFRF